MIDLERYIEINPKVLTGKPVIKGTRISVELILKLVAQGWTNKRIIKEYPSLKKEDIQATLLYAGKIVGNEEIFPFVSVK